MGLTGIHNKVWTKWQNELEIESNCRAISSEEYFKSVISTSEESEEYDNWKI